jgi:transposase
MDLFIGIDVSKDRLDVCVRPSGETIVVTRDDEGLERLVERLRALAPVLVALDATGGYETVVASAPCYCASAAGGDQSSSDPRFRPVDRQARQDRSSRRRGDRHRLPIRVGK